MHLQCLMVLAQEPPPLPSDLYLGMGTGGKDHFGYTQCGS